MCRTASPSRSLPRCWRCLPVRLGRDASGSSCSGSTTPAGTLSRTWLFRTGSGSSTCPHTPPSFSPPSTSGPFWMSHSPTTTSGHLLSSSTSSPRAVAFSIAINSNPGQTSTGGPSQTSRPNQPETVSLGSILVATTAKGVCAILLGDDPDALARDLQDRFPNADLKGGDRAFEATVAQVVGFIEAPRHGLDLPLDIGGTAFQQRVWQALREIPAGTTATYAEIARAVGEPRSARAVAQACRANALAVAIPCHRVVRSDGMLSGYRWGVERKRELLAREGVVL